MTPDFLIDGDVGYYLGIRIPYPETGDDNMATEPFDDGVCAE